MADVTGTLRKVTLDGVTFDVFADSNINATVGAFESTSVPTSGRNMHKMVKRPENREGLVLVANGDEQALLLELSERTTDFTMSYMTAAGDVYRADGWIMFESHETEENRAAIQMHPRTVWSPFLAN